MKFEEMKHSLIAAAEAAGVKEYEIYYQASENISAETLKDEISAFSSSADGGICFRCIVNGRMGYASGERMTAEEMELLVERAISNASCIDNDDKPQIFAGSPSYATLPERDIHLSDAATVRDTALRLQKEMYAASDKVSDGTQSAALSMTAETRLYNSSGLELSGRVGVSGGYAMPVVRDGEEAQEAFEFSVGEKFEDMPELPARAVTAALEKLGAGTVPSGKYDILFDGKQFRSFLSTFSSVFSAKNAQMGLSLLAGKEGEVIAAPSVTIIDDPMREDSPMQTAFDGEGVATKKRVIVENGVLNTLLYDLTTAAKAGVESTGHGQKGSYASPISIAPYSFSLAPGVLSREELLDAVGDGIYITECKGFHAGANPVTGDFSIESAGFRIRGGKLAEPIKSFTVAGNFFDLLRSVDLLGKEVKWAAPFSFTCFGSPDVCVRAMSVAGEG